MSDLYEYQESGVRWLMDRDRAYLADDCGLGKTVQALMAAAPQEDVAVVTKASTRPQWEREWREWRPDLNLTTYSWANIPEDASPSLVILDEAHYAKSPHAKRTKAALNLARRADRAWLLSASPMPNHAGEIWPAVRALWPHKAADLGIATYRGWIDHFTEYRVHPRWRSVQVYRAKNSDVLSATLSDVMLRRTLDDVSLELPPLRHQHQWLPFIMGMDDALLELGDDPPVSAVRHVLGQYKTGRIAHVLYEELRDWEYEKVVVMAHHRTALRQLETHLHDFGVAYLDGRTPMSERKTEIDRFNSDPDTRVFIGQQSAAGEGLNLQAATEIVLAEPDWTPEINYQAIKRIHRVGQTRPCRARTFVVTGSLDEAITTTCIRKEDFHREVGLR
jgi:SNF2 family DNA or RNA helicase